MTIHTNIYTLPTDAVVVFTQINKNLVKVDYSLPSDDDEELKHEAKKAIKEWASQPENANKILEMMAKSQKD